MCGAGIESAQYHLTRKSTVAPLQRAVTPETEDGLRVAYKSTSVTVTHPSSTSNPARIDVQPSQDTTVIRMYCAMTGVAKRASNSPLASVNVASPSTLLHAESSVLCWTVNAVTFWLTSERACARTP